MHSRMRTIDEATAFAFFLSQLTYLEQQMFLVKYQEYNYNKIVPVSSEAGEWATSVTYTFMDRRGAARFTGTKAMDVPIVDVGSDHRTVPVKNGSIGYDYSLEEIRQAIHNGRNLPTLKSNAAMEAYKELAHRTCLFGNPDHNLPGFLTNPNVPWISVHDWGEGKSFFVKSPDQILYDINSLMGGIYVVTLQREQPNRLLLPTAHYNYIATTRLPTSDMSILQWLIANSPYLASAGDIIAVPELGTAGEGGTARMVAYKFDKEKLIFHLPLPLRFVAPQAKGLGWIVPGEFKMSGTEIRYPASVAYADDI